MCAHVERKRGRQDCGCDTGVWFEYLPAPTEQWSIISLSTATPCWQLLHACNPIPPSFSPFFPLCFSFSISLLFFFSLLIFSLPLLFTLSHSHLPSFNPFLGSYAVCYSFTLPCLASLSLPFSHIISPGLLVLSISLAVALPGDITKKKKRGRGVRDRWKRMRDTWRMEDCRHIQNTNPAVNYTSTIPLHTLVRCNWLLFFLPFTSWL